MEVRLKDLVILNNFLAALLNLSNEALMSESEITIYEEWEDHLKKSSVNAKYWFTVIELESLLLMFIKSLRQADFTLVVTCHKEMTIWIFSLDHTHHQQLMLVFMADLLDLLFVHENIYVFRKVIFQWKGAKKKIL